MYIFEKLLSKKWEAIKQMDDTIEANEEKKMYFNINDYDSQCLLECEI